MSKIKHITLLFFVLLAGLLIIPACNQNETQEEPFKQVNAYSNKVVFDWNELFLQVERYAAGYRPGPAPRALAYMGLSAYEACINGMPDYNSLAPFYPGMNLPTADHRLEYHWPTVINASYAYLMPRFFTQATDAQKLQMQALDNLYKSQALAEVSQEVFDRSYQHGTAVAISIFQYSVTDAVGHEHFLDPFQGYDWTLHFNKDGDWKPTFPGPGKPMGGVWGGARTFAITQTDKLSRPPLPYSTSPTSDLYSQAIEVYAQNTPTWSYEDEWVGEFWSDDLLNLTFSPGPRWLAIGNQALTQEHSNLETALEMSAKVGIALNDASVACWYSKFYYNVERPQSYINRVIDPNWKPGLFNPLTGDEGVTPSFPAYPSGHSTMGAAGAEALASIFGYSYALTDRCHEGRVEFSGTPRSFGSFLEMAQENAWSRVPLGVHFRMDCDEGMRFGTVIGRKVNALPWKR